MKLNGEALLGFRNPAAEPSTANGPRREDRATIDTGLPTIGEIGRLNSKVGNTETPGGGFF